MTFLLRLIRRWQLRRELARERRAYSQTQALRAIVTMDRVARFKERIGGKP